MDDTSIPENQDSTSFKLTYFPVKALAEPIRYLLSYGGHKFDDVRLEFDQWKIIKDFTPFGQVPILEINDKMVHQSIAICRYLGHLVELVGNSDLENLDIDAIVDTITDFRNKISSYNKEEESSLRKASLKKEVETDVLPFYLTRLNSIAESGYLALGRLTWADIYFVSILDYCNGVLKADIIEGHNNLCELRKNILNIPAIKEWIKKRPPSDY